MKRSIPIALAAILAASAAQAQVNELPIRAYCVKADQVAVMIGTPDPKKTSIFVDNDGDTWMVLKNEATGLTILGFESPSVGMFCATGIKGKPPAPPRGA